jgi:NADPH:quinone reductase-like Zn-dependent oxidoreductase
MAVTARRRGGRRAGSGLLRSLGANVTAVCGTDHVALVTDLGGGRVIDYTAEDFTKDSHHTSAAA